MNILFVASEIFPYAKSGGLADVAHSLPLELKKEDIGVYTIMPLYNQVDRKKFSIVYSGLTFDYYLNGVRHQFDIFYKEDSQNEFFIYNPILCNRLGLYDDEYGDFGDNGLRFGLFSYAAIELMLRKKLKIDVIHINDWQTSLLALLAKTKYHLSQKIVLTIHNLAYQGVFPKSLMDELELDWDSCFKFNGIEYYDNVNYLKAGINFSDKVTTVSETYANEIQTSAFGKDLDDVLRSNAYKLSGIVNGISSEVFNPKTDKFLYEQFSLESYEKKYINKKKLIENLNLEDSNRALFIFIGRFTSQKGVDLLLESINLIRSYEANFIFLGSGEEFYTKAFDSIKGRYKNIHIEIGYNEEFSRKLYAGADFLLMPSTFEPCGLNQMISMQYGVLPLVCETGGLRDTVSDFTNINIDSFHSGIGISFFEHNLFWFNHALAKALSLYSNKPKFEKISKHNMGVDNSWTNSIKKYIEIYKG